jgi:hypothetical protein
MAFGRTVKILPRDTDRHVRTVDEVILPDGRSLNQELVREGMARWYRHYAPHDAELARLEAEAKSAKRGLWSQPHPVPPWEWRKGTLVADLVDLLGLAPTDIEAVGSVEDQARHISDVAVGVNHPRRDPDRRRARMPLTLRFLLRMGMRAPAG